ncbi:MAG: hypothetical protein H7A38_03375 [Chlamydiales bacterium]|nr:hypothetical protein [Chlamydiales bacterium]
MEGAQGARIQISFWRPVYRERNLAGPVQTIAAAVFDLVIDPLYTSPFYPSRRKLHQQRDNPWIFTTSSVSLIPRKYQLLRVVGVIAGLILYRRATITFLVAALAVKVLIRSKESCYPPAEGVGPQGPSARPELARELTQEQKEANCQKWVQKWWCDAMFYLFAMGMDETVVIPKAAPEVDPTYEVTIGIGVKNYPLSFLSQLPFFQCLLSSGMRDVVENRIYLTADFPYTHEDLMALKTKLGSCDARGWKIEKKYDFLCVGMRREEASHVAKLGKMQRIILEKDYAALPSHCPLEPPVVKGGSYQLDFLPSQFRPQLNFETQTDEEATTYARTMLEKAIKLPMPYYHVNQVINEFVCHLYDNDRETRKDLITPLLNILKGAEQYLTVLEIPPTLLSEGQLTRLLSTCPNLRWLSLDPFETQITENQLTRHEKLMVLKVEGQRLEMEQMRIFFPGLEILEG